MNPGDVAPMVLGIVFFVVAGGVVLLRPITKRLGLYLEVLSEEKRSRIASPRPEVDARLVGVLESMEKRLARLEERQEFTDDLLSGTKRGELSDPKRQLR